MPAKKKTYGDFNAHDMMDFWCTEYRKTYGVEYPRVGFIGTELSHLKGVIDKFGAYATLRSIRFALNSGERSIKFYAGKAESFMSNSDDPRLDFLVSMFGEQSQKEQWALYRFLETKWFPEGSDVGRKEKVHKSLDSWSKRVDRVHA